MWFRRGGRSENISVRVDSRTPINNPCVWFLPKVYAFSDLSNVILAF
jgi:hypothetical protein